MGTVSVDTDRLRERHSIWLEDRFTLCDLLQMLKSFQTSHFGAFLLNFERACAFTELLLNPPSVFVDRVAELQATIPKYQEAIRGLLAACDEGGIPLSQPVKLQLGRLYDRLQTAQASDFANIAENARIARQSLLDDLSRHLFFHIPEEYRELFERDAPFGVYVSMRFPEAKRDIEASCRCLALHEWTASVFHLMRVLEHGLRVVAKAFDVPCSNESWHKVISGIEDEIDFLRNKANLTPADRDRITFYSEAASQFRHFKDAWRNHASHSREHYDERDAWTVFTHVREFMQHLAQ